MLLSQTLVLTMPWAGLELRKGFWSGRENQKGTSCVLGEGSRIPSAANPFPHGLWGAGQPAELSALQQAVAFLCLDAERTNTSRRGPAPAAGLAREAPTSAAAMGKVCFHKEEQSDSQHNVKFILSLMHLKLSKPLSI